jgi:anaerobic ribonucleoside-triphosphate reductase activating protein|uniref:4Fe-4S single cluster domain protein n=1 Tax=Myoviridae sp. ctcyQ27 TaxID=2825139 RepID=A0A8S5UF17_9CAUD|nr:MAG TPA: 4Fe-4S single cluster domain protein [Myoviridae sp. ctcyQ27]
MNYHNITKDDMKNGDGLRVVLWVAGCSHHCPNCQNPVTWDPDDGILFDENARKELLDIVSQDYISGITFSGGDPLFESNREEVYELIEYIKSVYPNKTVWLYTGYTFNDLKKFVPIGILNKIDVIIDGPYIEKFRDTSLKWRGSSNQRVINVRKTIDTGNIVLHCD